MSIIRQIHQKSSIVLKKILLIFIISSILFLSCSSTIFGTKSSLEPIINTPYTDLKVKSGESFTLKYIIVDDNPSHYIFKKNEKILKSGPITTSLLVFVRSDTPGSYIFILEVIDFSGNYNSAEISVEVISDSSFFHRSFSEKEINLELDLAVGKNDPIDIINDLDDPSTEIFDSKPHMNKQVLVCYSNRNGSEDILIANEKIQYSLNIRDLLDELSNTYLNNLADNNNTIKSGLEKDILNINCTNLFQERLHHFTSPWRRNIFVSQNVVGFVLNKSKINHANDILFGTFSYPVELVSMLKNILIENGHNTQIENFSYQVSSETSDGVTNWVVDYYNPLIFWKKIGSNDNYISLFNTSIKLHDEIIFGPELYAITLFDKLRFEYTIDSYKYEPLLIETKTIQPSYEIGRIKTLIIKENLTEGSWNYNPFSFTGNYTMNFPMELNGINLPGKASLSPPFQSILLPKFTCYYENDARIRLDQDNTSFGIISATATFGEGVFNPQYRASPSYVNVSLVGNTYFITDYSNKFYYKLYEDSYNLYSQHLPRIHHLNPWKFSSKWLINDLLKNKNFHEFNMTTSLRENLIDGISSSDYAFPKGENYQNSMIYYSLLEFPVWSGQRVIYEHLNEAILALQIIEAMISSETRTSFTYHTSTDPGTIDGFLLPQILVIFTIIWIRRKR